MLAHLGQSGTSWRNHAALVAGAALAIYAGRVTADRSALLAGAAVLGAAFAVLALRRAEVAIGGLFAVVALLPFGVVPLRLGAAPTLLDVATLVVLVVWLGRLARGQARLGTATAGAALAVFAAALVGAYLFSPDPLRPDQTARTFIKLVAAHVVFIPLAGLVMTPERAGKVARWLVALVALQAVAGIMLYAVPRDVAYRALASLSAVGYPAGGDVLRYRPDTDIVRATGTSIDPNMLGALLMAGAAIVASQLVAQRPATRRRWLALALAPIAICLLLTESRGAWLGLAGGLLLVTGLKYRWLWAGAAVAGAFALATPYAGRFTGHLIAGLRAQDRASAMRLGEIENALAVIARHPWFGVGWGGGWPSIEQEFTLGVSNIFLTVAQRSGLPAAALYVAAWLAVALTILPGIRRCLGDARDDGLLLGLGAALAGSFIAGMVDHHFVRFPHLVTLLWSVAALAVVVATAPAASGAAQDAGAEPIEWANHGAGTRALPGRAPAPSRP